MQRSLIRFLTALAAVSLLMLPLAPAATAAPWGQAVDSAIDTAGWFESARAWFQELLGLRPAPSPTTKQKALEEGNGKGGGEIPGGQGDTGVCTDPNGNRAPCSS